uniref:Uncharacterized protein n=1 Tax=Schizaphis graminum TaxID=13262 RepID=A0A2S2NDE1_SCHGA
MCVDGYENVQTTSKQKLITSSTLGLKVTKHTALELIQYLFKKVGYKYLMTRRISQDVLNVIYLLFSLETDHSYYTVLSLNPNTLIVLASYVVRKMKKIIPTKNCDILCYRNRILCALQFINFSFSKSLFDSLLF